ncbi:hypothetical protein HAX54_029628, partial [Datura stramonium]|nr:hypothetical protein [Datura stramonium]
ARTVDDQTRTVDPSRLGTEEPFSAIRFVVELWITNCKAQTANQMHLKPEHHNSMMNGPWMANPGRRCTVNVVTVAFLYISSMENLKDVELTEAQLAVTAATAAQNAQQGLRNQAPINRHAPPAEEPDLERTGMTPRRTSHPHIGKKSDHTDKGKEKVKKKHKKETGPLRSRPCLEKVKVRGDEVDCSSKATNKTYFDDDNANATHYLAKLENLEDHYTWVASLIAAGTPAWVKDGGKIYNSDLNIQAKHLLGFIFSRLTPSKNDNEVINITKIHNEINPKLKKRKQESVVPRASVIAMDLEHRVSELEGIGVREALAALKADMRKRRGFKDERAETNEKELEEEQVTKEIDKEQQVEVAIQRYMDDVTARMIGAGPSSHALAGEDVATTETTTSTQSEEAKDA